MFIMLASQFALVAGPGVIFFVLAALFVYKAAQICLYASSGVAEGSIHARTTQMTRGTQTRDMREEVATTVFL